MSHVMASSTCLVTNKHHCPPMRQQMQARSVQQMKPTLIVIYSRQLLPNGRMGC